MAEQSPILTDEQRQQYQDALTADAQARQEIRNANEAAIKTAVNALTSLASFSTVMTKLNEIKAMEGFNDTRFAAHVHGIAIAAGNLQDAAA